jgi:hypothetical protein
VCKAKGGGYACNMTSVSIRTSSTCPFGETISPISASEPHVLIFKCGPSSYSPLSHDGSTGGGGTDAGGTETSGGSGINAAESPPDDNPSSHCGDNGTLYSGGCGTGEIERADGKSLAAEALNKLGTLTSDAANAFVAELDDENKSLSCGGCVAAADEKLSRKTSVRKALSS